MRWKSVALAGALSPAVAGCNIYYYAARTRATGPQGVGSRAATPRELHRAAGAPWREFGEQSPRCAFPAEFRDGFIDGYVDYLDRGGNGSPAAVPPPRYT